jgi:hypothetical protein
MCKGHYPNPEQAGRFEITAIAAVPTTAGSAMAIELRDIYDPDTVNDPDADKQTIIKFKSDGNSSMFQSFNPPLKTITGIRAKTLTNTANILVYVR